MHTGFHELHVQTGLPWYLTIPLGAVIIRTTWTPIQIITARLRKPREGVAQLMSAWRSAYQESGRIKFPSGTEADAKKADAWVVEQLKARKKIISKHQKYWGDWVEILLTTSFIPVWIGCMNCLRRMAGDTRTVLSVLEGESATVTSRLNSLEPGFETNNSFFEPGLATESLYWIPDLVSGDPLWILPISYGVLATYGVWTRVKESIRKPKNARLAPVGGSARQSPTLSYIMLGLPSVFTFVIIWSDMATALMLYMLTNTATQLAQKRLLGRLLGTVKQIPTLNARQVKSKAEPRKWTKQKAVK